MKILQELQKCLFFGVVFSGNVRGGFGYTVFVVCSWVLMAIFNSGIQLQGWHFFFPFSANICMWECWMHETSGLFLKNCSALFRSFVSVTGMLILS